MPLQKISFEYDIPEGYRFKRYGVPVIGDFFIDTKGQIQHTLIVFEYDWIIVEKIPEHEQHKPDNTNRRKHADLIHAWAEGADIQFQRKDGTWDNVILNMPTWSEKETYRIKPKTKTVRFRNYLTLDGLIGSRYTDLQPGDFVKWLGDWQEVEIEE